MPDWTKGRRLATRLAHMPVGEVLGRSQQLVLRTAGRWGIRRERGHAVAVPSSRAVIVPALLDIRETARAARATAPRETAELLARADEIRSGYFDILGYGRRSFGRPVDWHWDPIHDRHAPRRHFSRIDPLDVELVGDHKIIWELNRHAWLVTLVQAHALAGDDRYATCAAILLREWFAANPPGIGINWASSLEVAMRLVAWLYAWPVLRTAPGFDPGLCRTWLAFADAHARHLYAFPSFYFSPNTHLTGEALALRLYGVALPQLGNAAGYRRLGEQILRREFDLQLRSDGLHYEQSSCYHRYTVEFLLADLLAGALNGWSAGDDRRRCLERAVDAMLPLVRPNGRLVSVGDEDGGQLLRLGTGDPLDVRHLLGVAAVMLGRADLKAIVGPIPSEVVWLLGPRGIERYEALPPAPPPPSSAVLPAAGYVAVRSGWSAVADHLVLDAGPHGTPRCRFGHAHDDALTLTIDSAGRPLVIDPGTGSYSDRSVRELCRSTMAHSTAWIDGRSHNVPGRAFEWLTASHARLSSALIGGGGALVDACHAIEVSTGARVTHRRRVVYWPGHGWAVWDRFEGAGERLITVQWVLAGGPEEWESTEQGLRGAIGGLGVFVHAPGSVEVTRTTTSASASPRYGLIEEATAFRVACRACFPCDVVTLIRGPGSPAPMLSARPHTDASDPGAAGVCLIDIASDEVIVLGGSFSGCAADLLTDAEILWINRREFHGLVFHGRFVSAAEGFVQAPAGASHWTFTASGTWPLAPGTEGTQ